MNKSKITILFFLLFVLGFGVIASRFIMPFSIDAKADLKTSYLFPEPKKLKPFSLTDQKGRLFTNEQLKGKWSLIFLGFTSCPDVCPTTMGKLASAYGQLTQHRPLQIIFLSVDPKRDTQSKLESYMNFFNPNFVAVTGEHIQLYPLSRDLGMVYAMVGEGKDYTVDHSASMALISPDGAKVAIIKPKSVHNQLPQINTDDLIADIAAIQQLYRKV